MIIEHRKESNAALEHEILTNALKHAGLSAVLTVVSGLLGTK